MMNFAKRLMKLRMERNVLQEVLASELKISSQTLYRWESGKSVPDLNQLIDLCKFFNVSSDYFLSNDFDADDEYEIKVEDIGEEVAFAEEEECNAINENIATEKETVEVFSNLSSKKEKKKQTKKRVITFIIVFVIALIAFSYFLLGSYIMNILRELEYLRKGYVYIGGASDVYINWFDVIFGLLSLSVAVFTLVHLIKNFITKGKRKTKDE